MRRQSFHWFVVPSLLASTLAPRAAAAMAPADASTPEAETSAPSEPSETSEPSAASESLESPESPEPSAASPTSSPGEIEGARASESTAELGAAPAASPADEPKAAAPVPQAEAAPDDPPAPDPAARATEASETSWTDDLSFGAFVDAYASVNINLPRPQGGTNALRAFDAANGFSLAWAGINTSYDGDRAGATIDLRFGTGPNAGWADDAIPGIQHVKQAYATWHALPDDKLSFDLGRFDTIYGAEVAESWLNHTYTRGALYNLAQPFWHTGLRIRSQLNDTWSLNGLLVNGWGHVVDNNLFKSVGMQVGFTPGEVFGLYAGYLSGAEGDDVDPQTGIEISGANWDLRHLADLVMTIDVRRLSLAFNADWVYDDLPVGSQQWYGGMLSAHFQARPWIGFGARGEYLGDPNGFMSGVARNQLVTGTLSLDVTPAKMLTIRLDARGDGATSPLFPTGSATPGPDETMPNPPELRQHQVTFTLGMVVHSF